MSPYKMNPNNLEISEITASEPKLIEKGSNKFCLIPLKSEDENIKLLFKFKKFKIYEHNSGKDQSFSLGINLNIGFNSEEEELTDKDLLLSMEELEKKIQELAMENKSTIKKLQPKFSNFTKEDFRLIKTDKSNQPKIYGKLYHKNNKITCPFWELNEKEKKMKIDPLQFTNIPLMGDVVVEIRQIFCGQIKSITCIVKEVLIREIQQPPSHFDEFEDEEN